MRILKECKRFLSFAGLAVDKDVNVGGQKIPRIIPRAVLLLVLISLSISEIVIAVHCYSIDLQLFLYPMGCLLFFAVKLAIYTVLILKTNEIAELIDYLQMVVTLRNVWKCWLKLKKNTFDLMDFQMFIVK